MNVSRLALLATVMSLTVASRAAATDFSWDEPAGGIFGNPSNWSPYNFMGGIFGPPGPGEMATFAVGNGSYTVDFAFDPTSLRSRIGDDHVTLNLGGFTYTLTSTSTSTPSLTVGGVTTTDDALLTLSNGTLAGQHAVIAPTTLQTAAGMVVGSGATLNLAGTFTVGKQKPGSLTVQSGGDVLSATGVLGESGAGDGSVTVTGAGSTWTNSGSVYVGGGAAIDGGNGTLSITNQGLVDVGGTLKLWPGGNVALDGGTLEIGALEPASGSFNWTAGTLRFSANLSVESSGPLGGSVTVGAGKQMEAGNTLDVGNGGSGTLNVMGGGGLTNATGLIGHQVGSTGVVTIDGSGSTWSNIGGLSIGNAGDGTLNIANGGRVSVVNADAHVGNGGSVIVDGGRWFIIGEQCPFLCPGGGTLTISGGDIEIKGGGDVHNQFESFVTDGGTASVSGVGSTWEFDDRFVVGRGQVSISNGGAAIGGSNNSDVIIGGWSGGSGLVNIDGTGSKMDLTRSLYQNNLFVGDTSNEPGILIVSNGGMAKATTVIVRLLGEIHGNGDIVGNVLNGGFVSPGTSPGALNVDGDYTQTNNGELLIELASALSYDQLLVTGEATLAGTLQILLLDGFTPSVGQTFTILTSPDVSLTFGAEMLPSVPGLFFDVIYNPQSVVLTVSAAFTADFDEDGDVDGADLTRWQGDFGVSALSDADDDGDSDGDDFLQWQRQLGSGLPTAVAVPEPATLTLLLLVGYLVARVRLQRR